MIVLFAAINFQQIKPHSGLNQIVRDRTHRIDEICMGISPKATNQKPRNQLAMEINRNKKSPIGSLRQTQIEWRWTNEF